MNPQKIDQYEIIREIGRGGMGFVYLCRDTELGRIVALKVMRNDRKKGIRPNDRQRFLREALTTARLQHPGIPPVFCVKISSNNELYYAMKLIEGQSLDQVVKNLKAEDPMTVELYSTQKLVEVLRDVCKTLQYVHAQGFLHRDLKPSNIFLGDFGEVYIIDWGLTKKYLVESNEDDLLDDSTLMETISLDLDDSIPYSRENLLSIEAPDEDDSLTLQGDLLGTPAYMAPEQTYRQASLTPSADIYSMGVILYRILTLKLPLEAKDLKSLVIAKRDGKLIHPDHVAPERDIPPELAAIAMQAMAHEPEDRFDSVQDFIQSLDFWLEGKSQFRKIDLTILSRDSFVHRPPHSFHRWIISEGHIKTLPGTPKQSLSRMYFKNPFYGDLRISMNLRVLTVPGDDSPVGSFGILFKSSEPATVGPTDHYALTFAGNENTRVTLTRNGTEIASNENNVIEPNKKYHIIIDNNHGDIKVIINGRVVISCLDRSPLSGAYLGFLHGFQPIIYSRLKISTRGLPLKTETIEIPEALMAEGCFDGATRRFMDIYRNHRYRYIGNWAAYRAGVATYRGSKRQSDAIAIWSKLRGSRYADLEKLGLARIELMEGKALKASKHLEEIIANSPPTILLRSASNFAQEHTQKLLRNDGENSQQWKVLDRWIRITLELDERLERHDPISVSLLWRWIFQTITHQPKELPKALSFLRQIYGKDKGHFGDLITSGKQLSRLVHRTLGMKNHTFLLEKLMRLIIWHEDPIQDLETLGRFYLNSGHERIALQTFQSLIKICINADISLPPSPAAYVSCYLWLHGEEKEARRYFKIMAKACKSWGPSDAHFMLGLDDYRRGRRLNAVQRWKSIQSKSKSDSTLRYCISSALLGEKSSDPDEAGVPDRHDHRLIFCFFVGLRHFIDWRESRDQRNKDLATILFQEMLRLMKPSYDIYASTETFARVPLEEMGVVIPGKSKPVILSEDEKAWLKKLIVTIREEINPQ